MGRIHRRGTGGAGQGKGELGRGTGDLRRSLGELRGSVPGRGRLLLLGATLLLGPALQPALDGAGLNAQERGGAVASYVPTVLRDHDFQLSIAHLSRGPEFLGQAPEAVAWTDDSRWIYFRWLPAGHDWDAERELWRVPAIGGEPELIR